MLQRVSLFLTLLALLAVVPLALAQEAPSQIQFAVNDLSQRVGTNVTLDDLDAWTWEGNQYGDTSLGCPQPGEAYAQVITPGYQFILSYQGTEYDYRVSDTGDIVILCQTDQTIPTPTIGAIVTATAVPSATPAATAVPQQPGAECPNALPPRLSVGQVARTTPGLASNLRAQPDINAEVIDQVPPGAEFTVTGGPTCGSSGLLWWQVSYGTQSGWIAQGQNGLYYLEMVPAPLPPLTDLGDITLQTFAQIQQLSLIQGNVTGAAAWSPDGLTLAVANNNTDAPGVWVYDLTQLATQPPRLVEMDVMISTVAFSPDGDLAVGNINGTVEFWDLTQSQMVASFNAHEGAVTAMTFSPDGKVLATVGADTTVRLWGVPATLQSSG